MDLVGSSIELLHSKQPDHKFSIKTTAMLMDQLLERFQFIHSKDYVCLGIFLRLLSFYMIMIIVPNFYLFISIQIHRDVKPENFMMGRHNNAGIVYVIDFGLAKRYRDAETHKHIPFGDGRGLTGTPRYASIV